MKRYMVSQNTPQNRNILNYGKWTVMQEINTLPAGLHIGIDGKLYNLQNGVTAWDHVPGVPYFNTEKEAQEVMLELTKLDL